MNILSVLMWHHCLVRQRKFIRTAFEFVSPVILFLLLFFLRIYVVGKPPKSIGELNIHYTESMHLNNTKPLSLVLYSPSTQLTDILMDVVGKKLGIRRLSTFPAPKSRGYYALDNTSSLDLPQLVYGMKDNVAVVQFLNMNGAEFPVNLNYTIRMNVDFMIHIYRPLDEDDGPHQRFGKIYEPFIRLQWALDSSFLQMRTNNTVDREVYLQEIPFLDSVVYPEAVITVIIIISLAWCSLILPYIFLMQRLMEYRMTGLEELIKMVGVTPATLRLSHCVNMLPTCFLFTAVNSILLKASSRPLLPFSDIFLLFLLLLLFFIVIVLLAFIMSHISQSNQYAATFASISYIGLYIIVAFVNAYISSVPRVLRPLIGLLVPVLPFNIALQNLQKLEMFGKGLSWNALFLNPADRFSCFGCYVLLILQAFLLAGLGWYVAYVRPGKYGVARPCGFLCKRSYWRKVSPSDELMLAETSDAEPMVRDPQLFETVSHHPEVGIKIVDVSKVYGTTTVLSKVTLDVYKGEITVLLGHNGAGKTTLMSIITGMTSMSTGSVFVNGESLSTHPKRVRRHLGLCPQHNLTVPGLTVLQHTMFFAMLKGQSYAEAEVQAKSLLKRLGLDSKFKSQASELSGGMKRRLQLACAIAGGSTVLILDEPTSGLDVETRRELWDLLLALRGEHTVLLTTHFMEEADALGDRVAALHDGLMRCHATPMFLKKAMGTGYRLSLTTVGLPQEEAITSVITSVVPQAVLKEKSFNSITYTLPSQDSGKFSSLFSTLESKRSELNVETIGVGLSTLEEVFLKLCSNVQTTFTEDSVDASIPKTTYLTKKGICHYLLIMRLLMMRQLRYLAHNIVTFLCLQTIVPVGLIMLFTVIWCMTDETEQQASSARRAMDMNMYRGMEGSRVVLRAQGAGAGAAPVLRAVAPKYRDVQFETTQGDVASSILNNMMSGVADYNKYIAGIELNSTHAKVLYTTAVRHAAPAALNMLSNMVAAEAAPGTSIAAYNEPLANSTAATTQPMPTFALGLWACLTCMIYVSTLSSAVALALAERRLGTRHIHVMAGCPPALHWLSTLAAHTLVYSIFLLAPTLLSTLIDQKETINSPLFVGVFFVILLAGTIATLASAYLLHFMTNAASVILSFTSIAAGVLPACIAVSLQHSGHSSLIPKVLQFIFGLFHYLSPPYATASALTKATYVAHDNAFCNLNIQLCPRPLSDKFPVCCEKGKNPHSYFVNEQLSPLSDLYILTGQTIVYMVLVVLIEYGIFGPLWDKFVNCCGGPSTPPVHTDPMVLAEKTYVDKAIDLPNKQIPDAMLVSGLYKTYCGFKPFQAVKDLSFSVKRGECFGLLGVNGAGKSSTFKMITGEIAATRGRCFADEHRLQWPRTPYLKSLGYCPQFFGMDEFMTGRANLTLLLTLCGVRRDQIAGEVNTWINVAGLERYADLKVGSYSGGCARRLAAAAALAAGAPVTLLDEPTAGVDVAARRRVWLAVRRGLRDNRAVVLTSHSMDEMEALCNRIGIMAGGQLVALGSAAALRAAHASGHAVALKVKAAASAPPSASAPAAASASASARAPATAAPPAPADDPLLPLKQAVEAKFPCRLTEQHKTMLHYHVEDSVRYSELFKGLEELKHQFPNVIEDYSVTETTLEEVFLSYAPQADAKAAAAQGAPA